MLLYLVILACGAGRPKWEMGERIWDQYYLLFLLWRGNWIVERCGRLIQTFVAIVYLFQHGLRIWKVFHDFTKGGLRSGRVGTSFESSSFRITV